ncbi:DNA primase [Sneathiella sp. P13V-1]|uniref:DNA primase n=1 Tax=Sneathiella sp. P13V-1 TaxID=2697366 RepID=UPI00187BAA7D|nr:DNA primase [Sneathiella sp. P13V-1]MBE7638028.1 DNA primase [Sneathiella sp. P13V-1]
MMAFPPQFLDEIRNRVSLSELIGRRTKLVKKGREYSGLCPFHNEKTPSFTVNEEKGFYHCFGCGAHGDQVEFVKQTEGLNFRETIERLADMAGMQMPVERPQERVRREKSATLHDVMEVAAQWFTAQMSTQSGLIAREYLERRQVSPLAQQLFRIGFAPDSRTAMKEAMLARKIPENLLIEAGLVIKPDNGRDSYDRFRDRLMFPITDARGRVIAFGGRALGDAPAKYLNSPDTPLFHKGHVLYNMAKARSQAFNVGEVLVAEGYMDVIALAEAGFEHAVAPLGTAVTEDQIRILWKMAPEPTLCLDGDSAGVRAAVRAAERVLPLLKPGYSLKFAMLPEGLDPDDLIKQRGAAAMQELLAAAKPLSTLLWENTLAGRSMETPEQKAAFEAALEEVTQQIQDQTVRGYYQKHFRNRLWELGRSSGGGKKSFDKGRAGDKRFGRFANQRKSGQNTRLQVTNVPNAGMGRGGELLLLTVLNHPKILESDFDEFAALQLSSAMLDRLHSAIIEIASSESDLDEEGLKHHLSKRGFAQQIDRLEKSAQGDLDWFADKEAAFDDARSGWKHLVARLKRKMLQDEVKIAETLLGEDLTPENLERLKIAQKALAEAEGNEADLDGFGVASGRSTGF